MRRGMLFAALASTFLGMSTTAQSAMLSPDRPSIDNLVQLLLIDALCRGVLGFPAELVYGRILPGVAVSLLIGNLFYAWQAMKLGRRLGRADVCALPYGINTVSLFAYVFLVMLPAKLTAAAAGAEDPATVAWQAGLAACVGSGLIELCGAFFAEPLRRATPRARSQRREPSWCRPWCSISKRGIAPFRYACIWAGTCARPSGVSTSRAASVKDTGT